MLTLHGLRWYGKGETVTVGEYCSEIRCFYGLPRTTSRRGSFVHRSEPRGRSTPCGKCRWAEKESVVCLLSPTNAPTISAGCQTPDWSLGEYRFAFLFFYGLERRLLVEQQDQGPIVEEVVRLLTPIHRLDYSTPIFNLFLAFALASARNRIHR